ncbi:hypothetical protein D9M69_724670 [compost metagenome]
MDLLQAVNELRPTVVHFSGHGSALEELILQDDFGQPKYIAKQTIVHEFVQPRIVRESRQLGS